MVEGMRLWSCCIRERRPMKDRGAVDVAAEKLGVGAAAAGDIQDQDSGLFGLRCKSRGRALNWVEYPSPDTKVHIGTPLARTGKQAPRYREQVKRIAAQVNSVLGLSAEPTEYDYETIKPKDDSDEAMSSDLTYGEGRFLFQYGGSCASPTWQV
ncbi:hypothetical protein CAN33_0028570 [Aspergillus niger]|uniref:Uncharacterized protein n=1 Tax=Aspergillus niger TaxID=5061 RepID=A0A505I3L8_ASPNG|nr:hypothetical protein CAN33_0028570 [Aspergillus niger]